MKMASSIAPENSKCVVLEGTAECIEIEVSDVDEALLMTLLDESSGDEGGECSESVVRSLEGAAEIYYPTEDIGSLEDGQDSSMSSFDSPLRVDRFDWIDMEMDEAMNSPMSSDDMGDNWYMENFTDVMEVGMIEFGDLRDYNSEFEYDYSLWQGTY